MSSETSRYAIDQKSVGHRDKERDPIGYYHGGCSASFHVAVLRGRRSRQSDPNQWDLDEDADDMLRTNPPAPRRRRIAKTEAYGGVLPHSKILSTLLCHDTQYDDRRVPLRWRIRYSRVLDPREMRASAVRYHSPEGCNIFTTFTQLLASASTGVTATPLPRHRTVYWMSRALPVRLFPSTYDRIPRQSHKTPEEASPSAGKPVLSRTLAAAARAPTQIPHGSETAKRQRRHSYKTGYVVCRAVAR